MLKKTDPKIENVLQKLLNRKTFAFLYRACFFKHALFYLDAFGVLLFIFIILLFALYDLRFISVFILSFFLSFTPIALILMIRNHFWKKRFEEAFPDTLDVIIQSLYAAQSLKNSLAMAKDLSAPPLQEELNFIIAQIELGIPIELIMQQTAKKIDIEEFWFFTSSLVIQQKTGSSLADTLQRLSEILRARQLVKLKIQAISAQTRTSAYLMVSICGVLALFMSQTLKKNFYFFLHDPLGQKLGILCIFLLISGLTIILKMSRVRT